MKTGRKKITRAFLLTVLFALCIGGMSQIYAKHTPVYKTASETYVDKDNPQQIIIYVGDSRVMYCTVGKKSDVRNNYAFCFVNGGRVSYIDRDSGKLTSYVEKYISKYKSRKPVVVFNFGLNGNGSPGSNARNIIRIYKQWMSAYPDIKFYVESIGPTILSKGSYSNPKVIKLNNRLRETFEPMGIWLDTYSCILDNGWINSSGKGMRDNYHYKWKTSKKILKKVRELVEYDISTPKQ